MCENENNAERVDNDIKENLGESYCFLSNNDVEINVVSTVTVSRERYDELVKREAYLLSLLRIINHNDPYDKCAFFAVADDKCLTDAGVYESNYTVEMLSSAVTRLINDGKSKEVMQLLNRMNISSVSELRPKQYSQVATELRRLGADI